MNQSDDKLTVGLNYIHQNLNLSMKSLNTTSLTNSFNNNEKINHKFQIPLILKKTDGKNKLTPTNKKSQKSHRIQNESLLKIDSTLKSTRSHENDKKLGSITDFKSFLIPSASTSASSQQLSRQQKPVNLFSEEESASDWSDDDKLLRKRKLESKKCNFKNSNRLNSGFGDSCDLRNFNSNKAVKKTVGRWSNLEKSRLIEAIQMYGYDWQLIEEYVETRTLKQIINYTNKLYSTNFEYPSDSCINIPHHHNKEITQSQNSIEQQSLSQTSSAQSEKNSQFILIQALDKLSLDEKVEISEYENQQTKPQTNYVNILPPQIQLKQQEQKQKEDDLESKLDQQIKEFINLVNKYESLYRLQKLVDQGDSISLTQLAQQIFLLRQTVQQLIEKNTINKRQLKADQKSNKLSQPASNLSLELQSQQKSSLFTNSTEYKSLFKSKYSQYDIQERLQKVIFQDLFTRLNIYSVDQIKQKYNKLSDWIDMQSDNQCQSGSRIQTLTNQDAMKSRKQSEQLSSSLQARFNLSKFQGVNEAFKPNFQNFTSQPITPKNLQDNLTQSKLSEMNGKSIEATSTSLSRCSPTDEIEAICYNTDENMILDSNEYSTEEPNGANIQQPPCKRPKLSLFYDISIQSNSFESHQAVVANP
ncbi:myb-like dna-binding shaqkyf class family protein [Stylonychia lemnae]|uniref:Myb-like dna-binding shaqkyf class family protein n=1 Tax=Stylonychia lemnae TaxID=5949 RepID=A0A078ANS7_STYLE|nr:myb-like dna-binding shaqkyf class family protein [Stylonychia lemnae]|eukprot:CDW84005.1 myb-like dna-binding shaqkyf class family protein [Stylonychia lemnae]